MIARIAVAVCIACLAACGSTGSNRDEPLPSPIATTLVVAKNAGYGDQTMAAGTSNARIGSATFTATTENKKINSIDISLSPVAAASITNLMLRDSATGTPLSGVITIPSAGNGFGVDFTVPASSSRTIDLYGNISTGTSVGTVIQATVTASTSVEVTGIQPLIENPILLQKITVSGGTLVANLGTNNPTGGNIVAGTSNVRVGQFALSAQNSAYTAENLTILVPNGAATSVTNVTVSYKDVNGTTQTAIQTLSVIAGNPYATAAFTGLTMYVPKNDSANLDVFAGTPTIASGASSGSAITVTLETGAMPGTFQAVDEAGNAVTQVNAGVNVASNGTFYVRKSIPTFAMLPTGMSVPATGAPLYRFSITADPAGAIEWSRIALDMAISGMSIANAYLVEESTGLRVSEGFGVATSVANATFDLSSNTVQPKYQYVAAGTTKTYALYGTVMGFTTGSSLAISLVGDTSPVANAPAASVVGNFVWSDRSSLLHSVSSSDWTNGYLLKDISGTTTYSK